jgi:uncharacterized sodium:solute symporter family permease YidK
VIVIGVLAARRVVGTKRDYFLAGDKLPWWMVGGSIVAANVSSHHFIGVMGAAYALGFPDLNVILRRIGGRLLPFGFLRILLGAKKVKDHRLFGLAVMPEWQGRGLDVLLYLQLYRALRHRIRRMERTTSSRTTCA